MNTRQLLQWLIPIKSTLLVFAYILSAPALAANFPLEIIQPKPNLDTKNRFYKAYPGLEYNVRLGVIGGVYPFRYELVTKPEGMTIDGLGEITWAEPVLSTVPVDVSVVVVDAESSTTNVSWTITVTTSGFRFVDSVNGLSAVAGGAGSFANPWKSFKDVYDGDDYASKSTDRYANEFVYWRAGVYTMDAYKEAGGARVPLVENNKPQVWLAYPGEKPVIDMSGSYLAIYSGASNVYFDGLEFKLNGNAKGKGITIDSDARNVTFRNNLFHGITNAVTGGNNSFIFITRSGVGRDYVIQDNEMHGVKVSGYGILGYNARNVLIENNVLHDIAMHPISPKEGTQMWFIRANRMYNNPSNSINIQYSNTSGIASGNIEISHNVVEAGGGKVRVNSNQTTAGLPVYIHRNTFKGVVQQDVTTASNGPFYWSHNVIENESVQENHIDYFRVDVPSRVVTTSNLAGKVSQNIVDSRGRLTPAYHSYVGTHGHELVVRPESPVFTTK